MSLDEFVKGFRILVADDEAPNRNLLQRILAPQGYTLLFASDGNEALKLYQLHKPHMILTDNTMPGMSGTAFVTEVRKSDPFIPVIFATGDVEPERIRKMIDLGAQVVDKPYPIARLRELVYSIARRIYGESAQGA